LWEEEKRKGRGGEDVREKGKEESANNTYSNPTQPNYHIARRGEGKSGGETGGEDGTLIIPFHLFNVFVRKKKGGERKII